MELVRTCNSYLAYFFLFSRFIQAQRDVLFFQGIPLFAHFINGCFCWFTTDSSTVLFDADSKILFLPSFAQYISL